MRKLWACFCWVLVACEPTSGSKPSVKSEAKPAVVQPAASKVIAQSPEMRMKYRALEKEQGVVKRAVMHAELAQLWWDHARRPLDKVVYHSEQVMALWPKDASEASSDHRLMARAVAGALFLLGEVKRSQMRQVALSKTDGAAFVEQYKRKSDFQHASAQRHIQLLTHCKTWCETAHWSLASTVRYAESQHHMAQVVQEAMGGPLKAALKKGGMVMVAQTQRVMAVNQLKRAVKFPGHGKRVEFWRKRAQTTLCQLEPESCK